MYKLLHKLPNDLRLRILANFKADYLIFHWLNDSWTCGFELVTRGFELVNRKIELVTRGSEVVTRGFELVLLSFQLVTSSNLQLVTRNS